MQWIVVTVWLCAAGTTADEASYANDCEAYIGQDQGFVMPHNCIRVGQEVAGRYLRDGLVLTKIDCKQAQE